MWGLVSDGGVHSHMDHIFALLKLAKDNGLKKVYIHCALDGRDTPPKSGLGFVKELQSKMDELGVGKIASVHGRYYIMDRDKRWDRLEKAYNALVYGEGEKAQSAIEYIEKSYENDITDEFLLPCNIVENNEPVALVKDNDSVIFFNFRPDRAREITRAMVDPNFDGFPRKYGAIKLEYVCFTEYDATMPNVIVAYGAESLDNTMGDYISALGLTQLRIAETEKYAHVTFFFNGGVEEPYKGEDRVLMNSPKVATYDMQPEMSAGEVTDKLVERIKSNKYDLIVVNYANTDMVGHTGMFDAAVTAVEYVDACIGRVMDAVLETHSQIFLCADHGNSDKMVDLETREPFTAHTTNPVPFVIINCDKAKGIQEGGKLCDISPTLLDMMGLDKPKEMTGHSLLVK
jgi:2,3-bisphosphoglycerate-independent phosphoglycerate mutase